MINPMILPSYRKSVRMAGAKFKETYLCLSDRHALYGGLFLKKYGCLGCDWKGKPDCPYGIGVDCYMEDVKKMGKTVHLKGDVIDSHDRGICPDREYELGRELDMCSSLNGLRKKRAESLHAMEGDISRIKVELDNVLADGMTIEDSGGNTELIKLFKEYISIHHKYHEKLDVAIGQEGKYKDAASKRMSADDINDQLKLADAHQVLGDESSETLASDVTSDLKEEDKNE